MALPLHVLERLPPGLLRQGALSTGDPAEGLPLGLGELDAALPDAGLLRGAVVELSVSGAAAGATRIALAACRAAQEEGRARGGATPWCAFVDPTATLHAPAIAEAGVELEHLLVIRPEREALSRVCLRVVESQAFAVVAIDLVGVPGALLDVSLGTWPRVIRRLAAAVADTRTSVLLVTDASAPRPLPLPVAQRIELSRPEPNELVVRVAKDKHGRISSPRSVPWPRSGPLALAKAQAPVLLAVANDVRRP